MTWGIFVYQHEIDPAIYSSVMADDNIYDTLVKATQDSGARIFGGRKGIVDKDIDRIVNGVNALKSRKDKGESFDFKKELEFILSQDPN